MRRNVLTRAEGAERDAFAATGALERELAAVKA